MRSREATSGRVVLDADMRPKAGQTQRTAARATHGSYGKPGESQGEAKRSEEEPPVLLNLRIGRKDTLSVAVCPSVHLLKIDAPMRELDTKRAHATVGQVTRPCDSRTQQERRAYMPSGWRHRTVSRGS